MTSRKMKKFFFRQKENRLLAKLAGCLCILLLCLIVIAGSAFVKAGADKAKTGSGKSGGTTLPPGPPTLSYTGPHTYLHGQTVMLAPTSSGVAAIGYSNTATTYGSGYYDPVGMATDAAGNLYVADYDNGLIKIPAGGGTPVYIASGISAIVFPLPGCYRDAAGNLYVAQQVKQKLTTTETPTAMP